MAQAGTGERERVINNFTERVSTGYIILTSGQVLIFFDWLTALLGDGPARADYTRGFRVRVGEDSHWLHLGE